MRFRTATVTSLFLIFGFALLGPLLVFWTAGYRWNPRNQRFEATGIVIVDTIPSGARISIGETESALVTPARLTGVFPRDYTLTLSRDGYSSWQQTLTVNGGKTTFIDNVHLFPKKEPTLFFEKPVSHVALSHDYSLIAASVPTDGFTEIWMIGAESGTATLEARLASSTVQALSWSPSGATLLVEEQLPTGIRATLMQAGKKISLQTPTGMLQHIAWSQDDASKLIGVSRTLAQGIAPEKRFFWIFPANGAPPTPLENTEKETADTLPLLRGNLLYGTQQQSTTTR
ncbi:PEGA domain-containing protein, partial [Patescibacteria group bacterium]|nr:PEGA domain-containing protein [Patescibacteria group bacterium]